MPDVHIYGGGMAGLSAAFLLEQHKKPYHLYETLSHWGGKLQTTVQDGFALDHGFQVIQSAYPALGMYHERGYLKDALAFGSGAWLLSHQGKTLLADPLREFPRGLAALGHPSISFKDVLQVVKLRNALIKQSPSAFFDQSSTTTYHYLQQCGFSQSFIEAFFKPFFSGIFLEEALNTPSAMFQFVFWALAKGKAMLMPGGIQTLPNRIVADLNPNHIHLNHPENPTIRVPAPKQYFSTQALYFAVDSDLGLGKFIGLNATNTGCINLMAIPSAVQKGYAPKGKHLLCISLRPGIGATDIEPSSTAVLGEAETLLGTRIAGEWLNTMTVKKALPADTPYRYGDGQMHLEGGDTNKDVDFHASGCIANPSLNAAILHGTSFVSAIICR